MSFESRMKSGDLEAFFRAVLALESEEECYRFFEDIATVAEIKSLAQRFQVAEMLAANETYVRIALATGASTATISRVKRALNYGANGYKLVINRLKEKE
ncbi:MAG: YerC/YecD family TrpR-related protein [Clostridiales bacterium]|nr:YerC/YecD family TrpR-related protein [Clostridiales bacterium]